MFDQAGLVHTKAVQNGLEVQIDPDLFKGRDDHLEDKLLINGNRGAKGVACAVNTVIRIDLVKDLVPLGQVLIGVVVASRSLLKNRLEHRGKFIVLGRRIAVALDIVLNTASKILEPTLQRHAHRKCTTGDDVLLHHLVEKLNHRVDGRNIFALNKAGTARVIHGIIDHASIRGNICRQHLRLEINTNK